jgi:hypothetical protein
VDEVKLSSAIHDVSTEERFTRWAGTRGTGWIDHILYSQETPTTVLVGASILDQSVWAGISDHRWVIAGFSFPDSIPQQPIPKRPVPVPPDVDLTDKKRVTQYQQRLSQVISNVKNPEASERLLQICLASQRTAKEIFGRRTTTGNTSMGGAHISSLSKLKQHAYWKYGDASLERRATHAGEGTESKRVSSRK